MNQVVEQTKAYKGPFVPGNKYGVGNRGPGRPPICTATLISQLNEVDHKTKKAKIHLLVANLIKLALGYTTKRKIDGKLRTVEIQPNLAAIIEVFDRVEGKVRQNVDISGQIEVEDVTAARAKLDKIIELKANKVSEPEV